MVDRVSESIDIGSLQARDYARILDLRNVGAYAPFIRENHRADNSIFNNAIFNNSIFNNHSQYSILFSIILFSIIIIYLVTVIKSNCFCMTILIRLVSSELRGLFLL